MRRSCQLPGPLEQDHDGRFQRKQITLHDAPDQCEIHTKVIVRESIAHAGDLLPRDLRATVLRRIGKLLDGLANDFELANDGSWRIRSATNTSRPTDVYCSTSLIASRMWPR